MAERTPVRAVGQSTPGVQQPAHAVVRHPGRSRRSRRTPAGYEQQSRPVVTVRAEADGRSRSRRTEVPGGQTHSFEDRADAGAADLVAGAVAGVVALDGAAPVRRAGLPQRAAARPPQHSSPKSQDSCHSRCRRRRPPAAVVPSAQQAPSQQVSSSSRRSSRRRRPHRRTRHVLRCIVERPIRAQQCEAVGPVIVVQALRAPSGQQTSPQTMPLAQAAQRLRPRCGWQ